MDGGTEACVGTETGSCYLVAPQVPVIHPDATGIGTLPLDILLLAIGIQPDL